MAFGTGPIPTENQFPCRTLLARLDETGPLVRRSQPPGTPHTPTTPSAVCSAVLLHFAHPPMLERAAWAPPTGIVPSDPLPLRRQKTTSFRVNCVCLCAAAAQLLIAVFSGERTRNAGLFYAVLAHSSALLVLLTGTLVWYFVRKSHVPMQYGSALLAAAAAGLTVLGQGCASCSASVGRTVRCARAVRTVGYFEPIFP